MLEGPFQNNYESTLETRRFSKDAISELEKRGYVVYTLAGTGSIEILRHQGIPFWTTWHNSNPDFEAQTAKAWQVAINPNPKEFFIPESNNRTLEEQQRMVDDFSSKLGVRFARAKMGEVGDYLGVVYMHFKATGDRLFGQRYDFNFARTVTPTSHTNVAVVGDFKKLRGLGVDGCLRDAGRVDVWAVPLVVPA